VAKAPQPAREARALPGQLETISSSHERLLALADFISAAWRGFYDRFDYELVASHQPLDFSCNRLHLFCRKLHCLRPSESKSHSRALD
jgi:hypothetical protein